MIRKDQVKVSFESGELHLLFWGYIMAFNTQFYNAADLRTKQEKLRGGTVNAYRRGLSFEDSLEALARSGVDARSQPQREKTPIVQPMPLLMQWLKQLDMFLNAKAIQEKPALKTQIEALTTQILALETRVRHPQWEPEGLYTHEYTQGLTPKKAQSDRKKFIKDSDFLRLRSSDERQTYYLALLSQHLSKACKTLAAETDDIFSLMMQGSEQYADEKTVARLEQVRKAYNVQSILEQAQAANPLSDYSFDLNRIKRQFKELDSHFDIAVYQDAQAIEALQIKLSELKQNYTKLLSTLNIEEQLELNAQIATGESALELAAEWQTFPSSKTIANNAIVWENQLHLSYLCKQLHLKLNAMIAKDFREDSQLRDDLLAKAKAAIETLLTDCEADSKFIANKAGEILNKDFLQGLIEQHLDSTLFQDFTRHYERNQTILDDEKRLVKKLHSLKLNYKENKLDELPSEGPINPNRRALESYLTKLQQDLSADVLRHPYAEVLIHSQTDSEFELHGRIAENFNGIALQALSDILKQLQGYVDTLPEYIETLKKNDLPLSDNGKVVLQAALGNPNLLANEKHLAIRSAWANTTEAGLSEDAFTQRVTAYELRLNHAAELEQSRPTKQEMIDLAKQALQQAQSDRLLFNEPRFTLIFQRIRELHEAYLADELTKATTQEEQTALNHQIAFEKQRFTSSIELLETSSACAYSNDLVFADLVENGIAHIELNTRQKTAQDIYDVLLAMKENFEKFQKQTQALLDLLASKPENLSGDLKEFFEKAEHAYLPARFNTPELSPIKALIENAQNSNANTQDAIGKRLYQALQNRLDNLHNAQIPLPETENEALKAGAVQLEANAILLETGLEQIQCLLENNAYLSNVIANLNYQEALDFLKQQRIDLASIRSNETMQRAKTLWQTLRTDLQNPQKILGFEHPTMDFTALRAALPEDFHERFDVALRLCRADQSNSLEMQSRQRLMDFLHTMKQHAAARRLDDALQQHDEAAFTVEDTFWEDDKKFWDGVKTGLPDEAALIFDRLKLALLDSEARRLSVKAEAGIEAIRKSVLEPGETISIFDVQNGAEEAFKRRQRNHSARALFAFLKDNLAANDSHALLTALKALPSNADLYHAITNFPFPQADYATQKQQALHEKLNEELNAQRLSLGFAQHPFANEDFDAVRNTLNALSFNQLFENNADALTQTLVAMIKNQDPELFKAANRQVPEKLSKMKALFKDFQTRHTVAVSDTDFFQACLDHIDAMDSSTLPTLAEMRTYQKILDRKKDMRPFFNPMHSSHNSKCQALLQNALTHFVKLDDLAVDCGEKTAKQSLTTLQNFQQVLVKANNEALSTSSSLAGNIFTRLFQRIFPRHINLRKALAASSRYLHAYSLDARSGFSFFNNNNKEKRDIARRSIEALHSVQNLTTDNSNDVETLQKTLGFLKNQVKAVETLDAKRSFLQRLFGSVRLRRHLKLAVANLETYMQEQAHLQHKSDLSMDYSRSNPYAKTTKADRNEIAYGATALSVNRVLLDDKKLLVIPKVEIPDDCELDLTEDRKNHLSPASLTPRRRGFYKHYMDTDLNMQFAGTRSDDLVKRLEAVMSWESNKSNISLQDFQQNTKGNKLLGFGHADSVVFYFLALEGAGKNAQGIPYFNQVTANAANATQASRDFIQYLSGLRATLNKYPVNQNDLMKDAFEKMYLERIVTDNASLEVKAQFERLIALRRRYISINASRYLLIREIEDLKAGLPQNERFSAVKNPINDRLPQILARHANDENVQKEADPVKKEAYQLKNALEQLNAEAMRLRDALCLVLGGKEATSTEKALPGILSSARSHDLRQQQASLIACLYLDSSVPFKAHALDAVLKHNPALKQEDEKARQEMVTPEHKYPFGDTPRGRGFFNHSMEAFQAKPKEAEIARLKKGGII